MASKSALPDLHNIMQEHRAQGFGWRYDGVDDWTTEAIFEHLRDLGIDTDDQRFAQQAAEAKGFEELTDKWIEQIPAEKRRPAFVIDFPMMAVMTLWPRLANQVACADLIEGRLYEILHADEQGRELPEVGGLPAAVEAMLRAARFIRDAEPAVRAKACEIIFERGYYDYHQWLLELIDFEGTKFTDEFREIADGLIDIKGAGQLQSALAVVLERRGERDEAIALARSCLEKFGDDIRAKAEAGDVLEMAGDDAEAERIWRECLPQAKDAYEWETVVDRLGELFDRTGRTGELDKITEAHPSPPPPPKQDNFEASRPVSLNDIAELEDNKSQQLISARVVGRNDPCPCGSGKKYKKCCMP